MTEYLFVYGTLMPGESNHHHVQDIPGQWLRGSVQGQLYPEGIGLAAGYPALVPDAAAGPVYGWLLVSSALPLHWPHLDAFEGPAYSRQLLEVITEKGDRVKAFVYVLAQGDAHGE